MASIPLNKATHFVGRNADVCDIVAEHPSLSRQHAVLQFGQNNSLFVMDLGSAQGTKVNKKPIAPNEFVLIHVGDILSFAASTRLYIVNGPEELRPEEYDSANVQAFRASLVQRSERAASRKQMHLDEDENEHASRNEGASWGFREDAINEDAGKGEDEDENADLPDYIKNDANYARKYGEKYSSSLRDSDVHEKDKAVLEKIRVRERKIQNMQDENKKIYMKERSQDGGLTEGQEAAVARNDKRIEELKAEIEELEYSINLKNAQRSYSSGGSGKSGRSNDNGDEDALLDTTSATADASTNWRLRRKLGLMQGASDAPIGGVTSLGISGQAWTYQSLSEKKVAENEALEKTRKAIEGIEAVQSKLGDDDEIDGYLHAAHASENQETLKKLRAEETSIVAKLKEIDRLLKIATPALIGLVQPKTQKKEVPSSPQSTGATFRSDSTPKMTSTSDIVLLEKSLSTQEDLQSTSSPVVPISVERASPQSEKASVATSKRPVGDAASEGHQDAEDVSKPPKKNARIVGPSRPPTLPRPDTSSSSMTFDSTKLQDGDRVWVPPKNQSGDGRTALNDKLGY